MTSRTDKQRTIMREHVERRDARRNERVTRGEILDALDDARMHVSLTGVGTDTYILLDTLREVFK